MSRPALFRRPSPRVSKIPYGHIRLGIILLIESCRSTVKFHIVITGVIPDSSWSIPPIPSHLVYFHPYVFLFFFFGSYLYTLRMWFSTTIPATSSWVSLFYTQYSCMYHIAEREFFFLIILNSHKWRLLLSKSRWNQNRYYQRIRSDVSVVVRRLISNTIFFFLSCKCFWVLQY